MKKIIYRGHEIEKQDNGQYVIKKDGAMVTTAPSEDAAYSWVDQERRKAAGMVPKPEGRLIEK